MIIQVVHLSSCQVLEAAQLAVVLRNHNCTVSGGSILCILDKLLHVLNAPFSAIVCYGHPLHQPLKRM